MKTHWANEGNPNDEGDYVAVIDLENGKPEQVFKGKTHLEVANKLMDAQMHASQRIDELKSNRKFDEPKPKKEVKPRVLTADERFKMAQDMQDPSKAAEAVNTAVEAAVGVPLSEIAERLQGDDQQSEAERISAECIAFAQATPEFFQCKYNAELIVEWLTVKGKPITRNNCAIAFEHLNTIGLMVQRPAEQPTEPTPQADGGLPEPTVITRPRAAISSTGIRAGDSGQQPAPKKTAPKYTLEDLERMPESVYRQKLTGEPGFAESSLTS
jgi:hypothetical protein